MASRLDEKNTAPAPAKAAGPANSRHTQSGVMAAVSVLKSAYTKLTRFDLSPINRRRLDNFRSSKRGLWSLRLFLTLFALSLCSELIANDRPLMVRYKGELLFPALKDYPESTFGGFLPNTSYRDPTIQDEILTNGWMLWAPVKLSTRMSPPHSLMRLALRCASQPRWPSTLPEPR